MDHSRGRSAFRNRSCGVLHTSSARHVSRAHSGSAIRVTMSRSQIVQKGSGVFPFSSVLVLGNSSRPISVFCVTYAGWNTFIALKNRFQGRMVGHAEVSRKRASRRSRERRQTATHFPQADFWPGVTSGLPVIRPQNYDFGPLVFRADVSR
jgi:hypothetical protein